MSASDMNVRFDWSVCSSYDYTTCLTLWDWAWEFLRRNPEFQMDWWQSRDAFEITFFDSKLTIIHAHGSAPTLERWDCLYTAAPDIDARSAAVFWKPSRSGRILRMHAILEAASSQTAVFYLRHCPCPASLLVTADGTQHLLFHGAGIQLAVSGASLLEPVHLLADTALGARDAKQQLEALSRFNDFIAGVSPPPPADQQRARLRQVLQALDGSLAGAPHRDIAVALFGVERVEADWNDPRQHLRDRVRRAINRGRDLMNGGYRKFLR